MRDKLLTSSFRKVWNHACACQRVRYFVFNFMFKQQLACFVHFAFWYVVIVCLQYNAVSVVLAYLKVASISSVKRSNWHFCTWPELNKWSRL